MYSYPVYSSYSTGAVEAIWEWSGQVWKTEKCPQFSYNIVSYIKLFFYHSLLFTVQDSNTEWLSKLQFQFSIPTLRLAFSYCSHTHVTQHSILAFLTVEPRLRCKLLSMARPVHNVLLPERSLGIVIGWWWTISIKNLRLHAAAIAAVDRCHCMHKNNLIA